VRKIFLVINKRDLVPLEQQEKTDKIREFLGRIADRTANILCQQTVDFEISRTLGADVEKLKSFEEQLTDRLDEVRQEREKTSDRLRATLRLELSRHWITTPDST
jgi:ribosome biogenesis GTPase A